MKIELTLEEIQYINRQMAKTPRDENSRPDIGMAVWIKFKTAIKAEK